MIRCPETRRVFDQSTGEAARQHLAGCEACRRAVADYQFVIRQARAAFPVTEALPDLVRIRVARNAAAEAQRAPWWSRLVPAGHTPVWAAVAPALLVAVIVALPLAIRHQQEPAASSEVPVRIDMRAQDGAVSLAWTDGNGKAYKVYKSSDPRRLGQGRAEVVTGNQWVDRDPDSSQIVFYRVE